MNITHAVTLGKRLGVEETDVGIDVPGPEVKLLVMTALDETELPVATGVLVALPVKGGILDEAAEEVLRGLRSNALMVISLWKGVKLDSRVLKKQLGPMMLGKYDAA